MKKGATKKAKKTTTAPANSIKSSNGKASKAARMTVDVMSYAVNGMLSKLDELGDGECRDFYQNVKQFKNQDVPVVGL